MPIIFLRMGLTNGHVLVLPPFTVNSQLLCSQMGYFFNERNEYIIDKHDKWDVVVVVVSQAFFEAVKKGFHNKATYFVVCYMFEKCPKKAW